MTNNSELEIGLLEEDNTAVVKVPTDSEVKSIDYMTYVRLLTPIVGLVGAILTDVFGRELTTSVEDMTSYISYALILGGSINAWYKNNNITKTARKREEVADQVIEKHRILHSGKEK